MLSERDHEDSALSQRVYNSLKKMIITGELIPGRRLNQNELSKALGVSRTPLLAAFSKLTQENLLESSPNRGVYVKQLSIKEIVDLYDIRLQLEPLGAQRTAEHATAEMVAELDGVLNTYRIAVEKNDVLRIIQEDANFHSLIMKFSNNTFLYNMVVNFDIIMVSNRIGLLNKHSKSLFEHSEVLKAIAENDSEKAKNIMFNHIRDARETLVNRINTFNMTYIKF